MAAEGDVAEFVHRGGIRTSSPVPYYAQLAEILREAITEGRLPPGAALPSEAELGQAYGLSRTSVRQALSGLVAEGLVRKEKGRGTFVRGPQRADLVVHRMRGFHDELTDAGRVVDTEVLLQQVEAATPDEATLLEVPQGAQVLRLLRLRHADGAPIVLSETVLVAARFPGLEDRELAGLSLYRVLEEEYDLHVHSGHRMIEAVAATRAQARHLGVRSRDPLLKLSSLNLDAERRVVELLTSWYRADRTTFQVTVHPG